MYALKPEILEKLNGDNTPNILGAIRGPDVGGNALKWLFTAFIRGILFDDYPGSQRTGKPLDWTHFKRVIQEYTHAEHSHYIEHIETALLQLRNITNPPTNQQCTRLLKFADMLSSSPDNGLISLGLVEYFEDI